VLLFIWEIDSTSLAPSYYFQERISIAQYRAFTMKRAIDGFRDFVLGFRILEVDVNISQSHKNFRGKRHKWKSSLGKHLL
jgi:hypothetical protein